MGVNLAGCLVTVLGDESIFGVLSHTPTIAVVEVTTSVLGLK